MSLLVRNGIVLTQDAERRVVRGDVLVDDGLVLEVGDVSRPEADTVVDADGGIVLPGLVNAHTHSAMTLLRGAADDLPLERWLRERIWPVESRLSADDVRAGARLGCLEMLASGVTAFAEMYFFCDGIAGAAVESGIRCSAGFAVIDAGTPEHGPDDVLREARRSIERWRKLDDGLVRPAIAPHGAYTCSLETLEACAGISDELEVPLHSHCSETRFEVYDVERRTGRRPVAQFAHAGALGDRTILAHCGWITKAEVRDIAAAGASVVHNPVANMKLATGGFTPLPELLEAGATVGLGTDGAASNNRLDPFETMKAAALVHKHHRWDAEVVPAQAALDMATRHGARALGLGQTGTVEVGAPADLVVVRADRPHMRPLHDPVSQVVYAARGGDVRATVVDGDVRFLDGGFPGVDAAAWMADAEDRAGALLADADVGPVEK